MQVLHVILNNLFKLTQMQRRILVSICWRSKMECQRFCLYARFCLLILNTKRSGDTSDGFDKEKAEARAHILAGLLIALDHIDEVIHHPETVRQMVAQAELMARYELSERQSQAILDMRLRRLTGLERDKIQSEYDLMKLIADLADI